MYFSRINVFICLAAISLCFFSFSGKEEYSPDKPPPASKAWVFKDIPYGPLPEQTLDIALPKGRSIQNTPLVIFIHGGGWLFGDKLFHKKEMEQFSDSGFACATINYRFMSTKKNIHHQEITADVLLAIDYLCKHAQAWNISDNRIGLAGHSAGGELSMIVGYSHNPDKRIKAVASWSGPSNFLDPRQPKGKGDSNILAIYVGASLANAQDSAKWKDASPYYAAQRGSVPTLIVQGERDPIVPAVVTKGLKARLDSLGVINDFLLFPGSGHLYTIPDLKRARTATYLWFKRKL